MVLLDQVTTGIQSLMNEAWNWFNGLAQQEWIALLAIGAGLGFLCMRGYGSRGNI